MLPFVGAVRRRCAPLGTLLLHTPLPSFASSSLSSVAPSGASAAASVPLVSSPPSSGPSSSSSSSSSAPSTSPSSSASSASGGGVRRGGAAYPKKYASPVRRGHRVSLILLQQLDNLGHKGEEVSVAPGYARNFLVPSGAAAYATEGVRAASKVVLPEAEARAIAAQREVNMLRARIGAVALSFKRATRDGVALYSGVTAADVVEALNASVLRKLGIQERGIDFGGGAAAERRAAGKAPEGAEAGGAAAAGRALLVTGEHTLLVEPRPGLWCKLKVIVESS